MTVEMLLTAAVGSLSLAVTHLYYRQTKLHDDCEKENLTLWKFIAGLEDEEVRREIQEKLPRLRRKIDKLGRQG